MLRKFFWGLLAVFAGINLFILVSGRFYLYKAIWYNTASIEDWRHFHYRMIPNDSGIPIPSSSKYNRFEVSKTCMDRLIKNESVAFMAIHQDSVIYERYWDGYSDSSTTGSFSMAKSILSVLIGIAVDEGKIKSIDEPVSLYIPDYDKGLRSKLTIRHLLQMSSGIQWDESYYNPLSLTTESYFGDHLESMISKLEITREPGKYFDYASGNQIILGQILKKATGKTVSEYMSEKLWKPLHAMHPASWSIDKKNGDEKGFCCVNSNIRDFSKIGMLYLHHGNLYHQQILSEEYINECIKPANIMDEWGKPCDCYGLSWWLSSIKHQGKMHQVYYMRGILGQYVMVCPDYELIVSRLGNKRDEAYTSSDEHHRIDIFEYTKAVLDAYFPE